jgi:hypothetical protein
LPERLRWRRPWQPAREWSRRPASVRLLRDRSRVRSDGANGNPPPASAFRDRFSDRSAPHAARNDTGSVPVRAFDDTSTSSSAHEVAAAAACERLPWKALPRRSRYWSAGRARSASRRSLPVSAMPLRLTAMTRPSGGVAHETPAQLHGASVLYAQPASALRGSCATDAPLKASSAAASSSEPAMAGTIT